MRSFSISDRLSQLLLPSPLFKKGLDWMRRGKFTAGKWTKRPRKLCEFVRPENSEDVKAFASKFTGPDFWVFIFQRKEFLNYYSIFPRRWGLEWAEFGGAKLKSHLQFNVSAAVHLEAVRSLSGGWGRCGRGGWPRSWRWRRLAKREDRPQSCFHRLSSLRWELEKA